MNNRLIWELLPEPWQACLEEAWASYCAGFVPIGAAITDASSVVIARGRNRIDEACGEAPCVFRHPLAHAEVNNAGPGAMD